MNTPQPKSQKDIEQQRMWEAYNRQAAQNAQVTANPFGVPQNPTNQVQQQQAPQGIDGLLQQKKNDVGTFLMQLLGGAQ